MVLVVGVVDRKIICCEFRMIYLSQVRGKTTVACAAGGSFAAQPSSRRKAAKKDFPPDEKLASLRKEFEKSADNKGLDAYIVPSEDAHQVNNIFYCETPVQFLVSNISKQYMQRRLLD